MRRASALALTLLVAAVLDGCGGEQSKRLPKEPTRSIPNTGHSCTPGNEALQCILPPPPKQRLTAPPTAVVARGIDFAWGAPSASTARSRYGASFGASYLSHDPSKGWTQRPGLVADYHSHGLGTVAVWETSANRAAASHGAGEADAREARAQAAALGNTASTIYFAIDFDATGSQVDAYFRGVHAVLGSRAGAYGGFYPLGYLCSHGLIGKAWQTYAWSGGRWLSASCAPLEQYLNDGVVDYDRALATDYGQWPSPAKESRAQKRAQLRRVKAKRAVYHRLLDRHHCRRGQHVTPRQPLRKRHAYHHACYAKRTGWQAKGRRLIGRQQRLERELRS